MRGDALCLSLVGALLAGIFWGDWVAVAVFGGGGLVGLLYLARR